MSMTDEQFDALLAEARKRGANYPHLEINFENRLSSRLTKKHKLRNFFDMLHRPALAAALGVLIAIGVLSFLFHHAAESSQDVEFYILLEEYSEMLLPESGDLLTSADIWMGDNYEWSVTTD